MGELETPADKEGDGGVQPKTEARMSRKEKRKTMKKMKRKQTRKEIALKQHEEEEARLQDPQELINMEQEEAKRSESVRTIFEERERAWIEAMEIRKKKRIEEEEERRISALEYEELSRKQQIKNANDDGDDDWEYVEEGPAEIIWQENEITVKKKRIKVPKRNKDQRSIKEDSDRPTSNPLPPQSEAFDDYKNASLSAQQLLESVAEQVPHFGTEQDKDHCPFHLKTGACRFGQHCSRVHFYPDKSSTLLIKNMYNGPGLTWEQDEGLEYIDEEIERCYEDFYEDVHTEFLKFGEIINFKVCINGAPHLRGNVYVQYSALESALVAHQSVNGRYFAGKQISCDFINVTRWKVAICGEYVKSRYKTCSRGRTCNFIHCFRNPGGEYEWADSDRPPPKYWVEKMVALFGYSDAYKKHMMEDNSGQLRNSSKKSMTDSQRYVVQRSSSRDGSYSSFAGSSRRYDHENYAPKGTGHHRPSGEENAYLKDFNHRKNRKYVTSDDVVQLRGKVACEISSADELTLTELMFNGVFKDRKVEEMVSLLLCFVWREKLKDATKPRKKLTCSSCNYKKLLGGWLKFSLSFFLVEIDIDSFVSSFRPDIMEATYAWAKGSKFYEMMSVTGVFEGSLIRAIRRVLQQLIHAANSIGEIDLLRRAVSKIKRHCLCSFPILVIFGWNVFAIVFSY